MHRHPTARFPRQLFFRPPSPMPFWLEGPCQEEGPAHAPSAFLHVNGGAFCPSWLGGTHAVIWSTRTVQKRVLFVGVALLIGVIFGLVSQVVGA